ncbi:hypothetical protein OFP68_13885 [Brachyspira hyodysenteriae]|nr:hypothetical protein [Brachyspira hyodysenteriae]MCZ9879962.1 hypothetical protein [Brachyspira hyodysenteriae]
MFSLDFKQKVDRRLFGSLEYIMDRLSFIIGKFLKRDHTTTEDN